MPRTLEIPDSPNMVVCAGERAIEVSTTIDGEKVEETFEAKLPRTLADAIAFEGEKEVFDRYIRAFVIFLQGQKRAEIAARKGDKAPRRKAKYLEELGL